MEFVYIIFMKMVKYFIFQIMFCLPPKENIGLEWLFYQI